MKGEISGRMATIIFVAGFLVGTIMTCVAPRVFGG